MQQPPEYVRPAPGADHSLVQQIELHRPRLVRRAFRILRDRQAAEDLAQETWIRAFLGLPGFRGGSFLGWLERILHNACVDEVRRTERRGAISLNAAVPDRDDAELPVEVRVGLGDGWVSVTDRGGGFSPSDDERPDLASKLAGSQTSRGWGLLLMQEIADEVRTQRQGERYTVGLLIRL